MTPTSATGQLAPSPEATATLFPGATTRVFPKTGHIALAADSNVAEAIDRWWGD